MLVELSSMKITETCCLTFRIISTDGRSMASSASRTAAIRRPRTTYLRRSALWRMRC